jgi:hypothetical protein
LGALTSEKRPDVDMEHCFRRQVLNQVLEVSAAEPGWQADTELLFGAFELADPQAAPTVSIRADSHRVSGRILDSDLSLVQPLLSDPHRASQVKTAAAQPTQCSFYRTCFRGARGSGWRLLVRRNLLPAPSECSRCGALGTFGRSSPTGWRG